MAFIHLNVHVYVYVYGCCTRGILLKVEVIHVDSECRRIPSIITIVTWTHFTVVLCFKRPEWLGTDMTRL